MLGEENGDFPALLSAGPFVSCACPGMNMPCCSVTSVQVLPIMLRAFPDFIFLSRPAGQMNSGGRAPKKGMCHCSSGSIHLLSCSLCRKQLVLACHPVTKAACSATCRTCFPGLREHPAPVSAWLPRAWQRVRGEQQSIRLWLLVPSHALQIGSGMCSHVAQQWLRHSLTAMLWQSLGGGC